MAQSSQSGTASSVKLAVHKAAQRARSGTASSVKLAVHKVL